MKYIVEIEAVDGLKGDAGHRLRVVRSLLAYQGYRVLRIRPAPEALKVERGKA